MRLRRTRPTPLRALGPGDPAPAVVGHDPSGAAIELATGPQRYVLYFVTSTCRSCETVWATLSNGLPGIAITPDAATEDRRKVRSRAAEHTTVVMSSAAWLQYGAGPAPWRVVIEDHVVVSSGPALLDY